MNEKTKKIINIALLVIFLPSAIYLLAVKALLQFFILAAVVAFVNAGLKRLPTTK